MEFQTSSTANKKLGTSQKETNVSQNDDPYFGQGEIFETYIDETPEFVAISSTQRVNENHQDTLTSDPEQSVASSKQFNLNENEQLSGTAAESDCDEKPFKCQETGCTKSFKRKSNLTYHLRVHRDERPFQCEWSGCIKSFKSKSDMKTHLTVHSDKRPFKCQQDGCASAFKSKGELKAHKSVHVVGKTIECKKAGCTKKFKSEKSLYSHLRVFHSDKLFYCGHAGCTDSFKSKLGLTSHIMEHINERPFKCNKIGCTRSYKTRNHLQAHIKAHEQGKPLKRKVRNQKTIEKKYRCTFDNCGVSFDEIDLITRHHRWHTETVSYGSHILPTTSEENCIETVQNIDCASGHFNEKESSDWGEKTPKADPDIECEFKTVRLCSLCGKAFTEESEYQGHVECCGKYPIGEFVEIKVENDTVDVKSEY